MEIKLEDVGVYGLATKALLNGVGVSVPVKAYSTDIGGTWETLVFDVALAQVLALSGTRVLISLKKGETAIVHGFMEDERSILTDLEFKIERCRVAGTILDSVGSFGLAAFRDAINRKDIGAFHVAYEMVILRLAAPGIATALLAKGFTGADITSITTVHDLAWNKNTVKITLKTTISSLSVANRAIIMAFLGYCQLIIDSVHGYASKVKNGPLILKASAVAVKRTVVPTIAPKPVVRNIEQNTSICWLQHPVKRDLMEITLLTKGGVVYVCRMNSKTGVCGTGLLLVYNTKLSVKKMDVPGEGDCIIITNAGGQKVRVRVFRVKG